MKVHKSLGFKIYPKIPIKTLKLQNIWHIKIKKQEHAIRQSVTWISIELECLNCFAKINKNAFACKSAPLLCILKI